MKVESVNNVSFKGIRKVVRFISTEEAKRFQQIQRESSDLNHLLHVERPLLKKVINFLYKNKIVGTHYEYADGTFMGNREFADGTKLTYSVNKVLTKMFGEKFFSSAFVRGKRILCESFPFEPFDKAGRPNIPTLRDIKQYNKLENILSLIRSKKLKILPVK